MLLPPLSKIGPVVVLGILGCAMQGNADEPARIVVPPTIIHATGQSTYIPTPGGPGIGAPPVGVAVPGGAGQRPPFVMPPRPPSPKPKLEDAKKLLEVLSLQKACTLPLDLTVGKASLKEIVAQISKQLGEKAPRIEVHDELPIRLSFAIKDSTLREVLETTGGLAGVKLWVLPDHLLLAPSTALSGDESGGIGGTSSPDVQRVFASLLADELSAKAGGKGTAGGTGAAEGKGAGPSADAKTTFADLSPEGKEMLQGLVDMMNEINRARTDLQLSDGRPGVLQTPFTLTPDTVVELNGSASGAMRNGVPVNTVSITQENRGMRWATDGGSWGSSYRSPLSPKPGSAPVPPLFDPSANKS